MFRPGTPVLAVIALMAGLVSAGLAQKNPRAARTSLDAHRSLGAPRAFSNLTVVPVYDSSARSMMSIKLVLIVTSANAARPKPRWFRQ